MKGLPQQAKRADFARLTIGIDCAGHQDHGNPRERAIVKLRTAELRAVHHRQQEIEKDDTGFGVRSKVIERFASIPGGRDAITVGAECDPQQIARLRVVVDNENGAAVR
jgi:hypothetical protein